MKYSFKITSDFEELPFLLTLDIIGLPEQFTVSGGAIRKNELQMFPSVEDHLHKTVGGVTLLWRAAG